MFSNTLVKNFVDKIFRKWQNFLQTNFFADEVFTGKVLCRLSVVNKTSKQSQLHVFENNYLYLKTLMTLIAEWPKNT